MAILLVIVALANIGLPLTNGFVGRISYVQRIFASAVTKYNIVFTVLAGITHYPGRGLYIEYDP